MDGFEIITFIIYPFVIGFGLTLITIQLIIREFKNHGKRHTK